MATENWAYLYGNKFYQISDTGLIRSLDRTILIHRNGSTYHQFRKGRVKASRHTKENPHKFVSLIYRDDDFNKINKTIYIHRAVADHFVKKPKNILKAEKDGKAICATHIIKDYDNNHHTNVVWTTVGEVISNQPARLADPTKSWRTRKKVYGYSGAKVKL